jgi:hypothetical protein
MKPTQQQLRPVANPLITNMLLAYIQGDERFVATRAFPAVPIDEESGTYPTVPRNYWFADLLQKRAKGNRFARAGYTFSSDTYKTEQWGLEHPIPDENRATSQIPLDLERGGAEWLAHMSNLRKERAFAADFMVTGVWGTTDDNSATDWDDSSGVPVTNCLTARRTVSQATGKTPNTILMGQIVYDGLLVNAQVVSLLQYSTQLTDMTRKQLLAQVLGFDNLLVSSAIYNSANGQQTVSMSPIIDDDALIYYNNPSAGLMDITAGKTFTWAPGGGLGEAMIYREQSSKSDVIQHSEQWDQKLMASLLGYIFLDIV